MKVKFNPFIKEVRGKIGNTVFRMCHTGEWQIARRPDMAKVKWSEAQKAHRRKFRCAVEYAKVCMMLPELHAYYLKMAHKQGTNRPFDEAVRDYFKGNCLNFDQASRQALMEELNCTAATETRYLTSNQAPGITTQDENAAMGPALRLRSAPLSAEGVAINEQNRPQRAGFASSSSTKTAPAPAGGPATMDDRWIVASLVMSESMNGESDFYSVSTMCVLAYGNAVGLPQSSGS